MPSSAGKRKEAKKQKFYEPSLPLTSPSVRKYHCDRLLLSAECLEQGVLPGTSSRRPKYAPANANQSTGLRKILDLLFFSAYQIAIEGAKILPFQLSPLIAAGPHKCEEFAEAGRSVIHIFDLNIRGRTSCFLKKCRVWLIAGWGRVR